MHNLQLSPENSWTVEERPRPEDVGRLRKQLEAHNIACAQIDTGADLAIFLRDTHGNIVAGITGWLWGTVLEVVFVWVHQDLRRQGIGERLVRTLEAEAQARGSQEIMLPIIRK